jgi:hypothetical protein
MTATQIIQALFDGPTWPAILVQTKHNLLWVAAYFPARLYVCHGIKRWRCHRHYYPFA